MEVLLSELAGSFSPAALRVYADRLLERGDVHGEFISLQCEREERGETDVSAREEQLRRDVLEPRLREAVGARLRVTKWHFGLVSEVVLNVGDEPVTELESLARRPEGLGLSRLEFDALLDEGDLSELWRSLLDTPRFPLLRQLGVHVFRDTGRPWVDQPPRIGSVSPLYSAYPKLEVLELHGIEHALGDVVLPELRRFAASGLRPECIPSLVHARWPKLEELELQFVPAPAESEPVFAALLDAPMSDVLKRVKVKSPWPEFFRAALPRSPLGRGREIEV